MCNQSRSDNLANGITGMLLYIEGRYLSAYDGRFMQVLEGTESNVRSVFEKIIKDSRHQSVLVLKESSLQKRNFPTWTMGFKSIKLKEYKNLPGFFSLDDSFLSNNNFEESNAP